MFDRDVKLLGDLIGANEALDVSMNIGEAYAEEWMLIDKKCQRKLCCR